MLSFALRAASRTVALAFLLIAGCASGPSYDRTACRTLGCEWQSPCHRPCYELRHHGCDCCTCRHDLVNQIDDIFSP